MTTVDITPLVEELASLTDAVTRLGALAKQPVQAQSSVEIARNSKEGCCGREYQAHSCPCHHWDRKPLVDGFCADPTCSCSEGVYPLGVRP